MNQKKPEAADQQRQQRHREIALYVGACSSTPDMALDPAFEEAGIASWRAADPGPTT